MRPSPMTPAPLTVAITGASGAPYAVRLIEQLVLAERPVSLIISSHGFRLLATEMDIPSIEALQDHVAQRIGEDRWDRVVRVFDDSDRGATPASGSALSSGMVICPCSMGTVSAIAHGSSRSLIERSADVVLKEGRKLILVPRETPLSAIHLQNLLTLSQLGVTVLPAAPGFYHRPGSIDDLVDFVVARILDHVAVPHNLGQRWGE